jgi:hypothetical protein
MKPPAPPKVAVAVTCTCGKKIVLEPRWVGKPTGCAACGRDFVVRMLWDPQTSRWSPSVNYTPTVAPDHVKTGKDGQPNWLNVACECGHKIGLVAKFVGRNMVCNSCGREFIVRSVTKADGRDTAVLRYNKKATAEVIDEKTKPAAKEHKEPKEKEPRESAKESKAAAPPKDLPAPPSEFHLLCTCGEELVVEKQFYNNKMYCAGCGALVELRLIFVPDRRRYELEARYLEAPQPPES